MAKKKRRWLKAVLVLALIVIVAVVAVLFVVTRSSFICGVVLPRVSEAAGMPIVAKRVRLSLFSEMEIRDLTVGPGNQPLLRAERIECGYEPLKLLRGELRVTHVRVDNAVVHVIQEPEEKVLASEQVAESPGVPGGAPPAGAVSPSGEDAKKAPFKPTSIVIPKLDLPLTVNITDVMVRGVDVLFESPDMTVDVQGVEVHIPRIQNGERVEIDLSAGVRGMTGAGMTVKGGRCVGTVGVGVDEALNPQTVEIAGRVDQLLGKVGGVPLDGRVVTLKATASAQGEEWMIDDLSLTESAKGIPEAVFAAKGRVTLAPLSCAVDIAVDPVSSEALSLVGGLAGGYTFGKATARYTGTVTLDPEMMIRSKGEFLCRTLTVGIPDVVLPDVPPVDVAAVHDVSVSLKNEELVASTVDVRVKQEGRETVKIALTEPLTVRWAAGDLEEGVADSRVTILVDAFPLSLANLFLGRDAGITVRAGTLNSTLGVTIGKLGREMAVSGPVTVKGLNVLVGRDELALSAIENELTLSLADFKALDITSVKTRILVGGRLGLQSVLTGKFDVSTLDGTVEMAVAELNQQLLEALPKAWLGGASVPILGARANVTSSFGDSFKTILAKGTIDIPKVKASYPGFEPFPTLGATVGFDAALKGKTCEIKRLDIASQRGTSRFLHFGVSGTIPLPVASGEAALALSSDGIDLKALADMVKPIGSASQARVLAPPQGAGQLAASIGAGTGALFAPGEVVPVPKAPPTQAEELGPIDLGGLALTATLALKNLTYDEVKIDTCTGSVRVAENKVHIPSMDLDVNGGKVNVSGDIDLGVKGFKYALHSNVSKLPFEPFVATFVPRFASLVTGSLESLDFGAAGAGTTLAAITKSLTANTRLDLGPVGIKQIPKLTAWADRIKVPELRHMQFDAGALEGGFEAGKALIRSFTISGHDQAAEVTGTVGLDQVLSLDVVAGVAGKVAERLGGLGILQSFNETRGEHAFLPVPIRVTGTITNPKIDFSGLSKDVVMKLGLDKANEYISEKLGGETATAVKSVLDAVPFPGRKSTGAAATPKDFVGGLLGVGTAILRDKEEKKAGVLSPPPVAPTTPQESPAPAPVPSTTQLPAPPAPALPPVVVQPPAVETVEAPLSDEERHRQSIERRQQRRKELENLGGSLLRGLLKGK